MKKRRKGVVLFYFESNEGEFLNVVFCSFLFCQTKETYIIYQIERLPVFSFLIFWEREWEGEEKKKKVELRQQKERKERGGVLQKNSAPLLCLFLPLSPSFSPSLSFPLSIPLFFPSV